METPPSTPRNEEYEIRLKQLATSPNTPKTPYYPDLGSSIEDAAQQPNKWKGLSDLGLLTPPPTPESLLQTLSSEEHTQNLDVATSPGTGHYGDAFKLPNSQIEGYNPATPFAFQLLESLKLETNRSSSGRHKSGFGWISSNNLEVSESGLEIDCCDQDSVLNDVRVPVEVEAKTSVACCTDCTSFIVDKEPFAPFAVAFEHGAPLVSSTDVDPSVVEHMIELVLDFKADRTNLLNGDRSRFFAFINPTSEYREVPFSLLDRYQDQKFAAFKVRCWFTCPKHKKGYQLLRYDHSVEVKAGYGVKRRELTPLEIARERRKFLMRKLSYGMDI